MFLKRQKVPAKINEVDRYIGWQDLDLGKNLNVFERVFRVVDCDDFTRKFYEYMGVQLAQPEQVPIDQYLDHLQKKDIKVTCLSPLPPSRCGRTNPAVS